MSQYSHHHGLDDTQWLSEYIYNSFDGETGQDVTVIKQVRKKYPVNIISVENRDTGEIRVLSDGITAAEFKEVLYKDCQNVTYEDLYGEGAEEPTIFYVETRCGNASYYGSGYGSTAGIDIYPWFHNTIDYIKEHTVSIEYDEDEVRQ